MNPGPEPRYRGRVSDERRASKRLTAYLPGEIEAGDKRSLVSITRDVSEGGLLVYSGTLVDPGVPVRLKVAFDGKILAIEGKVVRSHALPLEERSVWRTRLAIVAKGDLALAELYAALTRAPAPTP